MNRDGLGQEGSRGLEAKRMEPRRMEPRRMEPRRMEPRRMKPGRMRPQGMEPQVMEPRRVSPQGMEPQVIEPQRMAQEKDRHSLEKRGYMVRQFLGQGAFSRVYSVEEQCTGRRAACKISENTRLFKREEEILKKLKYPLFPEYYESWREGNTGFLLMEEVTGENLAELIRRGGKLLTYKIAELGMDLAEGLLYLHESQPAIVFRDVKPENIMLREDGRVKLLDFGCACMPDTDSRTRAGTPGFSAPEQLVEGGEQTHLCDVYGLGRTLQELLWAGTRQEGITQFSERQDGRRKFREGQDEGRRFQERQDERRKFREGQDEGRRFQERQDGRQKLWQRIWERRDRRRLEKFLAACVEKEPSARPADMRVVMAALIQLCDPALGRGRHKRRNKDWGGNRHKNWRGSLHRNQSSDFWQKGIKCEKNIRKSGWKTS